MDDTTLDPQLPSLRTSDLRSAKVLRAVRLHGPVPRARIASLTGLSPATVGRSVAALLTYGAVRERGDLVSSGTTGRPVTPVDLAPDGPVVVGFHIGRQRSVAVISDLSFRILAEQFVDTPGTGPEAAVDLLASAAFRLLDEYRDRPLVWGGVIGALRVTGPGLVDHDILGWKNVPLVSMCAQTMGVAFSVAPHVEAMAAAEMLSGDDTNTGTALLYYCRESLGASLVIEGRVHLPRSGPADLDALPVGEVDRLDDRGRGPVDTLSDSGVLRAARRLGSRAATYTDLVAEALANPALDALLTERGEALGRLLATVSAVTRPDTVILAGQAFTTAPRYLPAVIRGVRARESLSVPELRVTAAGDRIQQRAAVAVALDRVSADPEGVLGAGSWII